MKRDFRSSVRVLTGIALTAAVGVSSAQTPQQMEYERQQREYWRQQEQQRQEQQRQQQLMNENARRQQEQSADNARCAGAKSSRLCAARQRRAPAGASRGSGGADPSGAQAASAARAMWEKRPALPPDRNPLLGKWTRPPSTRTNSSDPFAALAAMAKGGLCEVLFGGGVFEFRPDRLIGSDGRTPHRNLTASNIAATPSASWCCPRQHSS